MSETTRERILRAAADIVQHRGIARLTLDAVAETAGLSKGGLIYHFPSKEALLAAMVEKLITVTERDIDAHRENDTAPGSWTRGYLAACSPDNANAEADNRLAVAVLAATAGEPHLLAPMRERQSQWRTALGADGIPVDDALVVRLAADGLWMNDLFGIPVVSEAERRLVLERLTELSGGDRS
ncbi:TetR family transcriptional regulator [Arhodomonas sp. AD133]|uniref:TetR/AcrR family transcriptional regulator n=1 Tax=Arhodomonas sp. AD133 TaxID=3415009 RepID=UPI003EB958A1